MIRKTATLWVARRSKSWKRRKPPPPPPPPPLSTCKSARTRLLCLVDGGVAGEGGGHRGDGVEAGTVEDPAGHCGADEGGDWGGHGGEAEVAQGAPGQHRESPQDQRATQSTPKTTHSTPYPPHMSPNNPHPPPSPSRLLPTPLLYRTFHSFCIFTPSDPTPALPRLPFSFQPSNYFTTRSFFNWGLTKFSKILQSKEGGRKILCY